MKSFIFHISTKPTEPRLITRHTNTHTHTNNKKKNTILNCHNTCWVKRHTHRDNEILIIIIIH